MRTPKHSIERFLTVSLALLLCVGSVLCLFPSAGRTATLEETANAFLQSALQDYKEKTESSFGATLKTLQQTVNELSEQWEKVADPETSEEMRQPLQEKIIEGQKALEGVADSFTGLARETADFHEQLDRSVQNLVDRVQGSLHEQLTNSQASFSQIAQGIASLAEDTTQAKTGEMGDLLARVGDHINALGHSIEVANQAVQSL